MSETKEISPPALLPAPVAKNCSELKIGQFIAIICDEMERPDNWTELFDEYLYLTKGDSNNAVLELHKQAAIFRNMYIVIDKLCEMVCLDQDLPGAVELNDALRSLTRIRVKGKMDKDELQRHLNVRTSYGEKLKEKHAEIEALEVKGGKSDRQDWFKQMALLGKYQGYRMNPEEINVVEYCATLNNFKAESKAQKAQKKYNS